MPPMTASPAISQAGRDDECRTATHLMPTAANRRWRCPVVPGGRSSPRCANRGPCSRFGDQQKPP